MINPDILLERRIRQIKKRVKEIEDTWYNRYEKDEEYEEEY